MVLSLSYIFCLCVHCPGSRRWLTLIYMLTAVVLLSIAVVSAIYLVQFCTKRPEERQSPTPFSFPVRSGRSNKKTRCQDEVFVPSTPSPSQFVPPGSLKDSKGPYQLSHVGVMSKRSKRRRAHPAMGASFSDAKIQKNRGRDFPSPV